LYRANIAAQHLGSALEFARRDLDPFTFLLNGGMEMKLKPLNDRVLVLRTEKEQKSAGGIIIPDTAKEKPQEGKVVAVGPGKRDEQGNRLPMDVKVDNTVLFAKYSGTEVKVDGTMYLIMRESDILAIVD